MHDLIVLEKDKQICQIHGDMCFNNIIYEPFFGTMKLIDPRGRNENNNLYYPKCYDIAKLSHSILGLYDSIVFGFYKIEFTQDHNILFDIYEPIDYKIIKDNFLKNFDISVLSRLKELMLFASMLPLHIKNQNNCLAFILRFSQVCNQLKI